MTKKKPFNPMDCSDDSGSRPIIFHRYKQKKLTLADAGQDMEDSIKQFTDWRHGVDKRLLEYGDRFDEQERRIKQAADYVKEIKGIVDSAIADSAGQVIPVQLIREPLGILGTIFYGILGGFLAFGLLILFALWYFR